MGVAMLALNHRAMVQRGGAAGPDAKVGRWLAATQAGGLRAADAKVGFTHAVLQMMRTHGLAPICYSNWTFRVQT